MKVNEAGEKSRWNRNKITEDGTHGCYFCVTTFKGSDIVEYCDDGTTAICPNCGFDSVLPLVTNTAFLEECSDKRFTSRVDESIDTDKMIDNRIKSTDFESIINYDMDLREAVYEYDYLYSTKINNLASLVNDAVEAGWKVDGDVAIDAAACVQRMRREKVKQ